MRNLSKLTFVILGIGVVSCLLLFESTNFVYGQGRGGYVGWYVAKKVWVEDDRLYIQPEGWYKGHSDCPRIDSGGGIIATLPIGHPATDMSQEKLKIITHRVSYAARKGYKISHYTTCVDNLSQYIEDIRVRWPQ